MKNKFQILILILSTALLSAQTSQNLNETILKIVNAYKAKDAKTLNSFVDKKWGITFIYQRGAHTNLTVDNKIDFKDPVPEYLPYSFTMRKTDVIFANEKTNFDCSTEKWNVKEGIYYEKVTTDNSISNINRDLIKYNGKEAGIDQKLVSEISSNAIRVTAINSSQDVFIFYLTPKNGKYYLTGIDRFEVCSA